MNPGTQEGAALKAYMAYDREAGASEGAALVFARDVQEARKTAFPVLSGWGVDYLDVAAQHLPEWGHQQADPDKLAAGIPHVIETPDGCPQCEIWGHEIMESGLCESCDLEHEDEAKPAEGTEAEQGNTEGGAREGKG